MEFPRTSSEAARWVRLAAEQGHGAAQAVLAVFHFEGAGVAKDFVQAHLWASLAVATLKGTDDEGQAVLALRFVAEGMTPEQIAEAERLAREWKPSAGKPVERTGTDPGEGTPSTSAPEEMPDEIGPSGKSISVGANSLAGVPPPSREAVKRGDAEVQFHLGALYHEGDGVAQDFAVAASWFRKAAVQGDAAAHNNLGVLHAQGKGVDQDFAEAERWFRKAAEQGEAEGQVNLGYLFEHGDGVEQDFAEAMRWYRAAAEQGNAKAQRCIGGLDGWGFGVPEDNAEAAHWFRLAAEQGDRDAQADLGCVYFLGDGVGKDLVRAYMWSSLSVGEVTGLGDMRENQLEVIVEEMTPAQLAEGKRLAADWRESFAGRRRDEWE